MTNLALRLRQALSLKRHVVARRLLNECSSGLTPRAPGALAQAFLRRAAVASRAVPPTRQRRQVAGFLGLGNRPDWQLAMPRSADRVVPQYHSVDARVPA